MWTSDEQLLVGIVASGWTEVQASCHVLLKSLVSHVMWLGNARIWSPAMDCVFAYDRFTQNGWDRPFLSTQPWPFPLGTSPSQRTAT